MQLKEIPCDCILAAEWVDGRPKLIDQCILPGKHEHLYLDHLSDYAHAIEDMVAHWRCYENHLAALFQALDDAAAIYYHGTVVSMHG